MEKILEFPPPPRRHACALLFFQARFGQFWPCSPRAPSGGSGNPRFHPLAATLAFYCFSKLDWTNSGRFRPGPQGGVGRRGES